MQVPRAPFLRARDNRLWAGSRARRADLSSVTGTTDVIGTDFYMSPEQALGRSDQVGPASDIFSLGVILYELVTDRRPFAGETSEEVRRQICDSEPPSIDRAHDHAAKDLNAIIGKCLEKSPERRYGTAQELAFDLQRLLEGKPIHARPISAWRRTLKLAKHHPLASSFIASVCLGALIPAYLQAVGCMTGRRHYVRLPLQRQLPLKAKNLNDNTAMERQSSTQRHLPGKGI